ncbi:uncharacterized protein LOC144583733 [Pogona vitticeps]
MIVDFQKSETENTEFENQEIYQSAIGSLMYLANWTRPDIAAVANILSRYVSKPTQKYGLRVKRVFRYLKGTLDKCLVIKPSNELKLKAYVDSDWANDIIDGKSVSRFAVMFADTLVGWKSRKQSSIATSTVEAEFAALSELCSESVWYKQLLTDLRVDQAITVYEDNTTCIQMATTEKM